MINSLQSVGQWMGFRAFLLVLSMLLASPPGSLGQDFGTPLEVEFQSDDGTRHKMTFVFSSPPVGGLVNDNAKPYLIGKTEISFQDLERIAPQVYKTLTSTTDKEIQVMLRNPMAYPAVGLGLKEVTAVVDSFNNRVSNVPLSQGKLSALTIRIPSASEWEHAMRSGRPAEVLPYLNKWRDFSEANDKERGSFEQLWKTKFPESEFNGTQAEFAKLIEKYSPPEKIVYLAMFDFFLKDLGRVSWDVLDPLADVQFPSGSNSDSSPADWRVLGAHRGYPEWVLMEPQQNQASVDWQQFQAQCQTEKLHESSVGFSLAGALHTSAFGTEITNLWSGLALPGGPKANGTIQVTRINAKASQIEEEGWGKDYYPAMRLVAIETLRPDWFAFVRESAISSENSGETKLLELEQFEPEILRLSSRAKTDLNIVKFYQAMVNYQSENHSNAGKILREAVASNGDGEAAQSAKSVLEGLRGRVASGGSASEPSTVAKPQRPARKVFLESLAVLMEADSELK